MHVWVTVGVGVAVEEGVTLHDPVAVQVRVLDRVREGVRVGVELTDDVCDRVTLEEVVALTDRVTVRESVRVAVVEPVRVPESVPVRDVDVVGDGERVPDGVEEEVCEEDSVWV